MEIKIAQHYKIAIHILHNVDYSTVLYSEQLNFIWHIKICLLGINNGTIYRML